MSDFLSQEEIDKLLGKSSKEEDAGEGGLEGGEGKEGAGEVEPDREPALEEGVEEEIFPGTGGEGLTPGDWEGEGLPPWEEEWEPEAGGVDEGEGGGEGDEEEEDEEEEILVEKAWFNPLEPVEVEKAWRPLQDFGDIEIIMSVELGKTTLKVGELLNLKKDSVIKLERMAGDNVKLMLNDAPFAFGEIVVINDNFGLRLVLS